MWVTQGYLAGASLLNKCVWHFERLDRSAYMELQESSHKYGGMLQTPMVLWGASTLASGLSDNEPTGRPAHLNLCVFMASRLVLKSVSARNTPTCRPTIGYIFPFTMACRRMTLGGSRSCITIIELLESNRYTCSQIWGVVVHTSTHRSDTHAACSRQYYIEEILQQQEKLFKSTAVCSPQYDLHTPYCKHSYHSTTCSTAVPAGHLAHLRHMLWTELVLQSQCLCFYPAAVLTERPTLTNTADIRQCLLHTHTTRRTLYDKTPHWVSNLPVSVPVMSETVEGLPVSHLCLKQLKGLRRQRNQAMRTCRTVPATTTAQALQPFTEAVRSGQRHSPDLGL